ncbi:MAG: GNAT family N-acetyltransferase [Candidatus Nanohaloarchaea archaeon]
MLELNYYEPRKLLEDDEAMQQLSRLAVDAFGKEDKTTEDMEESLRDHVLPHDGVLALEDEEFIGFASMNSVETPYGDDLIYGEGAAVRDDYQGEGLGTLLHVGGVLQEADEAAEKVFVGAKTQNPRVLSYMNKLFNAHPRPDSRIPEDVGRMMDIVPERGPGEPEYERPVIKDAYGEPLYDERPEHELAEFMDSIEDFDYRNGDAVVVVGKVDREELEDAYDEALENANVQQP